MPFKLRRDAKDWFRDLDRDLDLDWDMYYFCLLAGLAVNKKASKTNDDSTLTIYDRFPKEYKDKSELLLGLFTSVELKARGIDEDNKKQTHEEISSLIEPKSVTGLSSEGLNLMNRYADFGFDTLREWFEDRPRTLEAFLPKFRANIERVARV